MVDKYKSDQPEKPNVDKDLIDEGIRQLQAEIQVLADWLQELDQADDDSPASREAKKSYRDMLRSRREMLKSLEKQKNQQ